MIKNFDDVIELFEKSDNLEKDISLFTGENYKIERIKNFLNVIGNPEKKLKVIHIAGSKGKGTVSYITSLILSSLGKKCGLFLSPHVYNYRERFTLAGEFFKEIEYIKAATTLEKLLQSYKKESKGLTTFEKYLAYAIILFCSNGCEYAVLETGLGGRLDATNAVDSFMEIFTTIELEHTKILGNTLEKIAFEKSKIIKPSTLVFAAENDECVNKVLACEAKVQKSNIYFYEDEIKKICCKNNKSLLNIDLSLKNGHNYSYTMPALPYIFIKDSALSILALDYAGLINPYNSLNTLSVLKMPARFQVEKQGGFDIILDGAHTPKSISEIIDNFCSVYKEKKLLVFGCAEDKDAENMANILAEHFDKIIIQKPGDFKKSDVGKIYKCFEDIIIKNKLKTELIVGQSAQSTMDIIRKEKKDTLITGSFYLAELMFKLL